MANRLLPVYPRLDLELVEARGCVLLDAAGREYLDLYGGHAVCALGHGNLELVDTLHRAYATLDFYSNSVRMEVQQQAAEAVLAGSRHLAYAHFVNSGAEANESAIHVARQLTGRRRIVSFGCSFHGRTPGALAATGLESYRRRLTVPENPALNTFIRFGEFEDLHMIDDTVAAVLCESVPSLAGVYMPPEGYYEALENQCRGVQAMLIFDEIQGGVGRLGTWFAHEKFGVSPDLVTLAKSLGGGYPVGALLTTESIGNRLGHSDLGTTFGGGPVACAMVERVAKIVHRDGLMDRATAIFDRISSGLDGLAEVRGAGCLIGVQTPRPAKELQSALLERGMMVGTSAEPNTLRLLPPYVLKDEQIDRFLEAFREVMHA